VSPACCPDPLAYLGRSIRVADDRFQVHMQLLARRFTLVPLHDIARQLQGGCLRARQACVTFDDGYADNYEHAFPILRRAGIPATIFLTTGPMEDGRSFWWERLAALLAERSRAGLPFAAEPGEPERVLTSPDAAANLYDRCAGTLRALETGSSRDDYLDMLGAGPVNHARPLSWDAVVSMQRAGIDFGAHSHTHPCLSVLSDAAVRDEVNRSRDIIAKHLGHAPNVFAYPFGQSSPRVHRALQRGGFMAAVTTEQAVCSATSSPYLIPRLHVHNWDGPEFTAFLDKALHRGFINKYGAVLKKMLPPPALRAVRRLRRLRRH
jgi:peptidoglycan/xylan/chitin deacetylase (PgdA/CDA1 family)